MTAAATSTGVYVYGIVRADELPAISADGVAEAPVELVEHDGLAAIVSRLPVDFRVKRRDLNRHLGVLAEAFQETTVVACPFGTVLASEADVQSALLEERRPQLVATLDRLDGKVQLNVKAVYDEEELLRELLAANPEVARLREKSAALGDAGYYDRVRLGELVAALVEQRREHDGRRLAGELSQVTDDVAVEAAGEYVALKASCLVSRKQVKRFDETLEQLASREQPVLQFEVIGPLPPTAFAG